MGWKPAHDTKFEKKVMGWYYEGELCNFVTDMDTEEPSQAYIPLQFCAALLHSYP
jgi:hypothetical protein